MSILARNYNPRGEFQTVAITLNSDPIVNPFIYAFRSLKSHNRLGEKKIHACQRPDTDTEQSLTYRKALPGLKSSGGRRLDWGNPPTFGACDCSG